MNSLRPGALPVKWNWRPPLLYVLILLGCSPLSAATHKVVRKDHAVQSDVVPAPDQHQAPAKDLLLKPEDEKKADALASFIDGNIAEDNAEVDRALEDYKKVLARTGDYVHMLGTLIGSSSVRVMRESMQPVDTARIWAAQENFTCSGRVRLDADNPARENVFPGYKEGPDVNLKVEVLRIGDINFATVNGEVYSQIAMRLKANAPASKTIVVTLANGMANSGYIYSDEAYSHLTFQVIGSRLQPGCAEKKIVGTAIDLMHRSGE